MLIPNLPTAEGYQLGEHLARFVESEIAANPDRVCAERCETCAFRAGTHPNGCVPTVMDALKCLIEKVPFKCHEREGICAGYAVLAKKSDEAPGALPWKFSDEYGDGKGD